MQGGDAVAQALRRVQPYRLVGRARIPGIAELHSSPQRGWAFATDPYRQMRPRCRFRRKDDVVELGIFAVERWPRFVPECAKSGQIFICDRTAFLIGWRAQCLEFLAHPT